MRTLTNLLAAALLMGGTAVTQAANDGQVRVTELLSSSAEYRDTWKGVVQKQERLPEWVINLSGVSEPMTATTEDGDAYRIGVLCETAQSCRSQRLIVAARLGGDDIYALLVQVPAGLPSDKSPSKHVSDRYLGKPDDGMKKLLNEQLSKDPNWY